MPKLQCPKCKAVNQDVSADDPCCQCGTVLGASSAAVDTASSTTANSNAGPAIETGTISPAIQKQIERTGPQTKVPLEERYQPLGPNYAAIGIGVAILAIVILAILYFLKVIHF